MGGSLPSVNVTINGRVYRMACDEGQEQHLGELADEFNRHVEQLKTTFGEIGDSRLTVMAALMVADQLYETRRRLKQIETELETARLQRATATERFEGAQDAIVEALTSAAERVERLAASLGVRGS